MFAPQESGYNLRLPLFNSPFLGSCLAKAGEEREREREREIKGERERETEREIEGRGGERQTDRRQTVR